MNKAELTKQRGWDINLGFQRKLQNILLSRISIKGISKMKTKSLFLLALLAGCATGWAQVIGSTFTVMSESHAASTETCPAVENGEWVQSYISPDATQEYSWAIIQSTITLWNETCYIDKQYSSKGLYFLWRKIPYEIEWRCVEWDGESYSGYGKVIGNMSCSREIGYRKDGIVIWRKP